MAEKTRTHDLVPKSDLVSYPDLDSVARFLRSVGVDRGAIRSIRLLNSDREIGFLWHANYARLGPGFRDTPPMVVEIPLEAMCQLHVSNDTIPLFKGVYFPGSNLILINSETPPKERAEVVYHELLHYMQYLTNRDRIAFNQDPRGSVKLDNEDLIRAGQLLREGFSEYFAQRLIPSINRGGEASGCNYPFETLFMLALERIVGRTTLLDAGFSGDWKKVQQKLDQALGAGSFLTCLKQHNGAQIFNYLNDRIRSANPPVSLGDFEKDTVYKRIAQTLSPLEF